VCLSTGGRRGALFFCCWYCWVGGGGGEERRGVLYGREDYSRDGGDAGKLKRVAIAGVRIRCRTVRAVHGLAGNCVATEADIVCVWTRLDSVMYHRNPHI